MEDGTNGHGELDGVEWHEKQRDAQAQAEHAVDRVVQEDTDTRNAERFAADHHNYVRYLTDIEAWRTFNGKVWTADLVAVHACTKDTVRRLYDDVSSIDDDKFRKRFLQWVKHSESARGRRDMLACAASEYPLRAVATDFDINPDLLACANGVIELRTGALVPHAPAQMLSRMSPVAYDPAAKCERWIEFLRTMFNGDATVIDYLQRLAGYTLTGHVTERGFILLWGHGDNGKSTWLKTLDYLMGDYAVALEDDFFFWRKRSAGQATEDLMPVRGARFAYGIELPEGRTLASATIKRITGGDKLTGRGLYEKQQTWTNTAKLWAGSNYRPVIRDDSQGMWRRVHLVPCTVTIPLHKQDQHLGEKLLAEAPGILAWMVCGAVDWYKHGGVDIPASVQAATDAYRNEMNSVRLFFDECLILAPPPAKLSTNAIVERFHEWGNETGRDHALTKLKFAVAFGLIAKRHGVLNVEIRDGTRARGWAGLAFRAFAHEEDDSGPSPVSDELFT